MEDLYALIRDSLNLTGDGFEWRTEQDASGRWRIILEHVSSTESAQQRISVLTSGDYATEDLANEVMVRLSVALAPMND